MARHSFQNLLVRRVDNLGDIVIVLPVIRELRRHFPGATFTLMVKPSHRAIFHRYADNYVDVVPLQEFKRVARRYDLGINIALEMPPRYRPRPLNRQRVIHIGIPSWNPRKHIYELLLDGLAAHGFTVRYGRPKLFLTPEARTKAKSWLSENDLLSRESLKVAVHPGSGLRKKRWPIERYVKVCRWLIAEFGALVVVISKSKRESLGRRLVESLPGKHTTLLSQKPVDVLAAILEEMDLQVGNDSGIAHLASAVGTPTVTVFGPTVPGLWRPAGKKSIVVYNEEQRRLMSIRVGDVVDGITMCINKYLDRTSKPCLDGIQADPSWTQARTSSGIVLSHGRSPRSLLIPYGFEQISRMIGYADRVRSYSKVTSRHPEHRKLIEFLLQHRVLISSSPKKQHRVV